MIYVEFIKMNLLILVRITKKYEDASQHLDLHEKQAFTFSFDKVFTEHDQTQVEKRERIPPMWVPEN